MRYHIVLNVEFYFIWFSFRGITLHVIWFLNVSDLPNMLTTRINPWPDGSSYHNQLNIQAAIYV